MPEIETILPAVRALKGVHLYHADMSNCSQRVRMTLEEKGVPWQSHLLDLIRNEHATEEYQSINPKGVVPTLVHDGRTIIESVDIIDYIDRNFPGPGLMPEDGTTRARAGNLLHRAAAIQGSVKLLSHEFLFKPVRKMSHAGVDEMARGHRNRELIAFLHEFADGFSDSRIKAAVAEFCEAFDAMEATLDESGGPFLLGPAMSQADLAWIVNAHRVSLMGWDFSTWPEVRRWLAIMRTRPSYKKALKAYEPGAAGIAFRVYSAVRKLTGSSVNRWRPATR